MKLLLAAAVLFVSLGHANTLDYRYVPTEKNDKTKGEKEKGSTAENKNVHSVKKWKMTVEYTNGTIISKTIMVGENSELSALDTAFAEASKHLKNSKNVKSYSISPVPKSYVLLAGD